MEIETLQNIPEQEKCISQSCVACGLRCKRKFLYRYRWGLRPKIEEFKVAASCGTLFHRLMELGPSGIETVREQVRADQTVLMGRIQNGEDLTGELARAAQGLTELFNKALVMAQLFWTKFPVPPNIKTLGRELVVEMPPDANCKYIRRGKIDQLVLDEDTRDVWVRDTKTTSRDIAFTLSGCGWSIQSRFYRMLATHYVENLENNVNLSGKIRGFIYDVAQVPGIKFCKKDADFAAYLKRVEQWYLDAGLDAMSSKAIVFNEPILGAELLQAIYTTSLLLDARLDIPEVLVSFPRDVTMDSCKGFNRVCDYMKLCESDMAGWPSIINGLFTIASAEKEEEREVEVDTGG